MPLKGNCTKKLKNSDKNFNVHFCAFNFGKFGKYTNCHPCSILSCPKNSSWIFDLILYCKRQREVDFAFCVSMFYLFCLIPLCPFYMQPITYVCITHRFFFSAGSSFRTTFKLTSIPLKNVVQKQTMFVIFNNQIYYLYNQFN